MVPHMAVLEVYDVHLCKRTQAECRLSLLKAKYGVAKWELEPGILPAAADIEARHNVPTDDLEER